MPGTAKWKPIRMDTEYCSRGSKGVWEYEKNEKDHQPLAGCYFSDHWCGSAIWHPGNQAAANVKRYTVLVLDTSDTAEFTYNNETIYTADTALSDVKSAAGKFIRDISATGGDNYVAVISYKDYATTVSGFQKNTAR